MGAKVRRGESLRCKVKVRNFSKALVNAAAITLTITDPDGTVVATKTLVEISWESLGIYFYDYTPAIAAPPIAAAVAGTYTAEWNVTYSGLHRISRGFFSVIE
ncbi:hypothetical protein MUP79_06885 [Candidatus Bathyarchaeota archaeon]|nr:hypothetical protein [Candidatus Bathyarchaeota archaeon]